MEPWAWAQSGGWRIPAVDEALDAGHVAEVLSLMLRTGGERLGETYGIGAAEEFRVVTFGGLHGLLELLGERR